MPAIGRVTKQGDGSFRGQLKTLSIMANISIEPNDRKDKDEHPDFLITFEGTELGAG